MVVRSTLLFVAALLFASPLLADNFPQEIVPPTPPVTVAKISESEANPIKQKKLDLPHELMVKENYQYYDIEGTKPSDLLRQMKEKGTKWNDGKVYAALTTWDISYHYDVAEVNGKYSLKSITTDVDIIYHLPKRAAVNGEDPLEESWGAYYDNLKTHEFGHKDIAVKAAADINDSLASLGSFDSSSELEDQAKALVHTKLRKLRDDQVDYDAETHHGETQGAILQ